MKPEEMMVDKWDALRALTDACAAFDLTHRTLGVLKALMTFHPGRLIAPDQCGAIVFPSNKTLSDRLNGMPDSTLRRHLAKLVSVGIVSRHDSANRKRFARRGQGKQLAFGFDLSPLARHIQDLRNAAEQALAAREVLMSLRAEVGYLRQQVIDTPLAEEARQVLRRKPNGAALREIAAKLEAEITTKTSGTDDQNERHIQYEYINNSDSEAAVAIEAPKKNESPSAEQEPDLVEVLSLCNEFKAYYPDAVYRWTDLIEVADRLTGMMGIDGPVFKDAIAKMGAKRAAIVVLCMLERFGDIRNPGGYLRRLTQTARIGGFSERPLLDALRNSQELSADNLKTC